jgi:hypothetical protein
MALLHFRCKERRRTMRVQLAVPLKVQGLNESGETFSVQTLSHTVSLHGASVQLEIAVTLGDILLIENEMSGEKIEGKIVAIRRSRDGKTYVGIEFTTCETNFWHMAFPASGAKPLRRPLGNKVAAALS